MSNQRIVKAAPNRDYLQITLADIIVTYFNATGAAIGNSEVLNGIYDLYGNVTLENLVDAGIITGNLEEQYTKEEVKEMIGYGNLTVPVLRVWPSRLKNYLGDLPTNTQAGKALEAMFDWDNHWTWENLYAVMIGTVAEVGKIGYNMVKDVVAEVSDIGPVRGLIDLFNHFKDTTYFQDLLEESASGEQDFSYLSPYTLQYPNNVPETYRVGGIGIPNTEPTQLNYMAYVPENCIVASAVIEGYRKPMTVNISDTTKDIYTSNRSYTISITNKVIDNSRTLGKITLQSENFTSPWSNGNGAAYPLGMALYVPDNINTLQGIVEYCKENNPWTNSNGGGSTGNGTTDYINAGVGNLTKNNYVDASTNIKQNEYMYVFNRPSYELVIGEITQNNNSGNYEDNSQVITNYNNTYIQNPVSEVRPSTAPAPSEQPAQPFISPRPTQAPEAYESVIYDGGVPESIKNKFPFCIPWDIKALVDGLWSPTRKAPYIHWDATFGSWGKLGEVDIDFSVFDTAATIHRNIVLLLWIFGLVLITKNLIS